MSPLSPTAILGGRHDKIFPATSRLSQAYNVVTASTNQKGSQSQPASHPASPTVSDQSVKDTQSNPEQSEESTQAAPPCKLQINNISSILNDTAKYSPKDTTSRGSSATASPKTWPHWSLDSGSSSSATSMRNLDEPTRSHVSTTPMATMNNQSADQTVAIKASPAQPAAAACITTTDLLGTTCREASNSVVQSRATTMMITKSPMATMDNHSEDHSAAIKASPAQPAAATCITKTDLLGTTCREVSNPVNPPAAADCWQSKTQVTQMVRSVDCRSKMTLANQDWAVSRAENYQNWKNICGGV